MRGHFSTTFGDYRGVASSGGVVYAVGQTDVGGPNPDFLIESWDVAGNLLWSKTFDRTSGDDRLAGVAIRGDRLYAVGSTTGVSAGRLDGVILEVDTQTGNLLDSTLWGGTKDDSFNGLTIAGATLFAVGATSSFGSADADVALVSFALPTTPVPEPGTLALMAVGLGLLIRAGKRRQT